ncbi:MULTISPECIES: ATP-binding protein [Streptomyces]|uniref:ATP-binding protein n=1 Tax=Streptomyces TaxID=1883 RepID=UPI00017EA32B|nr:MULTISPECIES: ATP-binding protein [Streptomyces]AKL70608.1 regulator [Streptomyces sp. Mg1]EDX21006.1 regulatory protein [Streptomyces sp. Mg1]WSS03845.1 ATP-binding protein [Streptomyces goshikiensis]WSY02956.1 ATP-binding protein [Streptomyces goshikiensis]
MDQAAGDNDQQMQVSRPISATGAFNGSETIAQARKQAHTFLGDLHNQHGVPVTGLAADLVELVVSELVTNTRKYAPGPYRLTLELRDGYIEVSVWDSNPDLPTILAPDPYRIGRHGLEIVTAIAHRFHIQQETDGKRTTAAIKLHDPADH